MIKEQQIKDILKQVMVPGVERNVADLNLVKNISVTENNVAVSLANAVISPDMQEYLRANIQAALKKSGVSDVEVTFVEAKPEELNQITHPLAIMSGKGGVGKSLVTALLGVALRRAGNEVGILDADITGSTMPRMFGVKNRPMGSENGILPVTTTTGIELISMNLLLPQEDTAVIWRAPLLSQAIRQFWGEVLWGKLDYLLIDLPPGTADAPLTVMQTIPISGVVIVTTPQQLVEMIVKKAVDMATKMNKPILGIVENMSYFYVPELKKKYELLGKSKGEDLARGANVPLLAKIPIDPELAHLCDDGEIERYENNIVEKLGEALAGSIKQQ
jgi:Mrp family chromosome partitioning ATPase